MNNHSRRHFMTTGMAAAAMMGLSPGQPAHAIRPIQRIGGPRFKTSCAAYSYRELLQNGSMTIMDFLDECAMMGLDAAEPTSYYFPNDVSDAYLYEVKAKAFRLGLSISGTAIGNTFTHPPGDQRNQQLEHCKTWVDRAAVLGAPVIRIFAGNASEGLSEREARNNAIDTIEAACEYAGSKGVFLALENHGGVVATPTGMLEIVREVQSPWFGVNLDTGNFHSEDPYGDLAAIAPYAINVQLKVEMQYQGESTPADFERLFNILLDAGYRGYVALEYEAEADPMTAIPQYVQVMQKAAYRAQMTASL